MPQISELVREWKEVRLSDYLMAFRGELTTSGQNPRLESMRGGEQILFVLFGRGQRGRPLGNFPDPRKRADDPHWVRYWYSLWGAAIEAVAIGWKCDLQELLTNSTIHNNGEDIGQLDVLRLPMR